MSQKRFIRVACCHGGTRNSSNLPNPLRQKVKWSSTKEGNQITDPKSMNMRNISINPHPTHVDTNEITNWRCRAFNE